MKLAPELGPLLDTMIDFVESSVVSEKAAEERVASVSQRCQKLEAEKITLEKVAASAVKLDDTRVRFMLSKLASMGIVDRRGTDDLELRFREDPNALTTFVIKLAETLAPASDQGRGVAPENTPATSDPDGWHDALAGRPVVIRRN